MSSIEFLPGINRTLKQDIVHGIGLIAISVGIGFGAHNLNQALTEPVPPTAEAMSCLIDVNLVAEDCTGSPEDYSQTLIEARDIRNNNSANTLFVRAIFSNLGAFSNYLFHSTVHKKFNRPR